MSAAEQDVKRAVVFLHGILGADVIRKLLPGFRYFRHLRERLRATVPLHFPVVPSASSIANRAGVLQACIDQIAADELYLVAHSMGGLDARYLIHHCDPDHRIRALTTVGTPHRGTELVHWVENTRGPVQTFARHFLYPGILELTPDACEQFNRDTPDRPDVIYRSRAGCRPANEMPWIYRAQTRVLQELEGDNDSQVSVASASWGRFGGVVRADHLELAGWSLGLPGRGTGRPFEHVGFYQSLLDEMLEPGDGPSEQGAGS